MLTVWINDFLNIYIYIWQENTFQGLSVDWLLVVTLVMSKAHTVQHRATFVAQQMLQDVAAC